MPGWTPTDIPDLTGRTAVVTGANGGLGYHTALELARHGAAVVLACRNQQRGQEALARLAAEAPGADARVEPLDLADLASVRAFAAGWRERSDGLDILVNNAGIMAAGRGRTVDGFELHFGTNHLGHFALTALLAPALLERPGARVVTVTSYVHHFGRIHFDDLNRDRFYWRWDAYAQSKLANLVFAVELDRRATAAGLDLTSLAAHPGYAATNLQTTAASAGNIVEGVLLRFGNLSFAQSDAQGARPLLYAATAPDVHGGDLIGPRGMFGLRGAHPGLGRRAASSLDPGTGQRLWDVSEELTGVAFSLPERRAAR